MLCVFIALAIVWPLFSQNCSFTCFSALSELIIDEAQDLITSKYLDVFDKCLSGGLRRGAWTFLGDFSQQAIYNKPATSTEIRELLEDWTSFIRFKLTVNCRNTKTICDEISLVTGFQPPSEVWSKVTGMPVQYITYSNRNEEKAKLIEVIKSLLDAHISPKNISILSPVKKESSIVSEITEYEIKDYRTYGNNKLAFCTVHSFKGLENSVIILTDITYALSFNLPSLN